MSLKPSKIDFDRTLELPSFAELDHDLSGPLTVMCVAYERQAHVPDDKVEETPIALEIASQQALEKAIPQAIFANRFDTNVMGLFGSPQDCLAVAEEIIAALPFNSEICARIGIHRGEIKHNGSRLSGDAVEAASMIMRKAAPNWILASRAIYDHAAVDQQVFMDSMDYVQLQRGSPALELFRLTEKQDALITRIADHGWSPYTEIQITVSGRNHCYRATDDPISIGRGSNNEIVISDKYVSMDHAQIVRRDGEFVFIDRSTNGTFMVIEEEAPFKVPKEFKLRREARVWLGRHVTDPEATTLDIAYD